MSSGVRVTLTPPPPLLTSWRHARPVVCFLVTPLTTRGTAALTSPRVVFSSPDTLSSTSRISPFPPPPLRPPTASWSPCFPLTRWFSHLCLLVFLSQVFPVARARFRRPLLRHARPRSPPTRHARPRSYERTRVRLQLPPCASLSLCGSTNAAQCCPRCRRSSLRPRTLHLLYGRSRLVLRLAPVSTRTSTTRPSSIGILVMFIPW